MKTRGLPKDSATSPSTSDRAVTAIDACRLLKVVPRKRILRTCLAMLLAVLGVANAHAGLRQQCRQQCGAAINSCLAENPRFRRRVCRRQVLQQCKREGIVVCSSLTTSTTLTTASTTSTTTLPLSFFL